MARKGQHSSRDPGIVGGNKVTTIWNIEKAGSFRLEEEKRQGQLKEIRDGVKLGGAPRKP